MVKQKQDEQPQFYTRLPVLRAERGVSRKDVAEAVGVHYQTIGYLERGEYSPSLVLALRIAEFLRLPLDAVFSLQPFAAMSDQIYPRTTTTDRTITEE
jgi:putative transcriptional regulator